MYASWQWLMGLAILAGVAPAVVVPGLDDKELAGNRRSFEEYRKDPVHYERLKRDWRAFRALPPEKQSQMRQLHFDLHQEDSDTRARLERVLDRYAAWLEKLPGDDQERVRSAADTEERLQVIQEIRDREWVSRLPRMVRDQVQNTPAEKKQVLIAQLRQQDRQRRLEWHRVIKQRAQYQRLNDFPSEIQTFVNDSLRPLLSDKEKQDLKAAEGKWFFGATLAELAERHPIKLPPSPAAGPRTAKDLKDPKQRFPLKSLDSARLRDVEGKWPEFALYITEVARSKKMPLPPLGPCRPEAFSPPVQQFIEKELLQKLNEEDRKFLDGALGQWPEYPNALLELARKYKLKIPGMSLPGPREFWDSLRTTELPEVPDRILRDFALTQLTREEHADLQLSYSDPNSRERLKRKFFERNPEELQRLRTFDTQIVPRRTKNRL